MMTSDIFVEALADLAGIPLRQLAMGMAHSEKRIIAQTMNIGRHDDILLLERTVGGARLVDVMLSAAPGWIGDRSWEFWRGRLSFAMARPFRSTSATSVRCRNVSTEAFHRANGAA